jgi:hypothetical protein
VCFGSRQRFYSRKRTDWSDSWKLIYLEPKSEPNPNSCRCCFQRLVRQGHPAFNMRSPPEALVRVFEQTLKSANMLPDSGGDSWIARLDRVRQVTPLATAPAMIWTTPGQIRQASRLGTREFGANRGGTCLHCADVPKPTASHSPNTTGSKLYNLLLTEKHHFGSVQGSSRPPMGSYCLCS